MSQTKKEKEFKEGDSYEFEAKQIHLFEVKATVPASGKNKKAGSVSLGFARNLQNAEMIVSKLDNKGKIVEKEAFLVKKKDEDETQSFIILQGKSISCIFYIDNHGNIPLDQFRAFSKDQQRYLTLIGKPDDEEDASSSEEE